MYHGKRVAKRAAPKISVGRKGFAVIGLLSLMLVAFVGGTVALLSAEDDPITNIFTAGEISGVIDEEFENNVKSSVVINNTGDASAYIRVAVVGNWLDTDGNIAEPWTPVFSVGSGWSRGSDGYYYYNSPVAKGGSTTDLLGSSISGVDSSKPGLHLEVTVVQQTIQAEPASAVEEAWGFVPGGN